MDITNIIDIASLGNKLWCETLGYKVEEFATFTFLRSTFFNDSSYNYIIPKVVNSELDWAAADAIIQKQRLINWHVSYYIRQLHIKSDYDGILLGKGYEKAEEESYVFLSMEHEIVTDDTEYEVVTVQTIDDYANVAKICFPGWVSNEAFSRALFAAQQKDSCKNYLAKYEGKISGIGGVLYSKEFNLGYLTNACTLPDSRGKGVQQRMIQKRCAELFKMGITQVFSIAEPGCISYHNLLKNGFEDVDRYALYTQVSKN